MKEQSNYTNLWTCAGQLRK